MTPRNARPITLVFGLLAAASTLALAGCEDAFGPIEWPNRPDTLTLYSLARSEHLTKPGALDVVGDQAGPRTVILEHVGEQAFAFDLALTEDDTGAFVFLPTGYFPDANARPGILRDTTGATFEGLSRAPREDYVEEEPVPVETGAVYVVRTRTLSGCTRYGKIEVLAANADGTVELQAIRNPNCSDRNLLPTLEDEEEEEEGEG